MGQFELAAVIPNNCGVVCPPLVPSTGIAGLLKGGNKKLEAPDEDGEEDVNDDEVEDAVVDDEDEEDVEKEVGVEDETLRLVAELAGKEVIVPCDELNVFEGATPACELTGVEVPGEAKSTC
jgi:hypothetical protein